MVVLCPLRLLHPVQDVVALYDILFVQLPYAFFLYFLRSHSVPFSRGRSYTSDVESRSIPSGGMSVRSQTLAIYLLADSSTTIQKYKTPQLSIPCLLGRWQRRAVNIIESLKGRD